MIRHYNRISGKGYDEGAQATSTSPTVSVSSEAENSSAVSTPSSLEQFSAALVAIPEIGRLAMNTTNPMAFVGPDSHLTPMSFFDETTHKFDSSGVDAFLADVTSPVFKPLTHTRRPK